MNVKCKMLNMSMLGVLVSGMVLAAPTVLAKTVNGTMTAKEVELEIDNKGRKLEDVVAEWIGKNEAVWKPWVDGASM